MAKQQSRYAFAVCVSNEGCEDLQVWKLYRVLLDVSAAAEGYLRVVDESGEDYLYPDGRFVLMEVSGGVKRKLLAAAPSVA